MTATENGSSPNFLPVIVGTDLNAYYMARCFHEAYGIRSQLVGKMQMGFTDNSNFIDLEIFGDLWDAEAFVHNLLELGERLKQRHQHLILVGTNDFYVRLIVENAAALRKYYLFNNLTLPQLDSILVKDRFYPLCAQHGIDIPDTVIYDCAASEPLPKFDRFPLIIKPGDGDNYYRHTFEGQKKVYRLTDNEQVKQAVEQISTSGYDGKLILQDYIPGDDTQIYDSVIYANQAAKVEVVSFARVILQEHAPMAVGNYTALVTRNNFAMMDKLADFAEAIGYTGFGNFDLKFDQRDQKYKVFECNIRQGRSSYYVTTAGFNMAKLLIDDLLGDNQPGAKSTVRQYVDQPILLSVVPHKIVIDYVTDPTLKQEIKTLIKDGHAVNPLRYSADLNLKRRIYLLARGLNYFRKYRKYHW